MNNYKILGIIIIIGLVFSIFAATIFSINSSNEKKDYNLTEFNDGQLNLTENDLNGIKTVNINLKQEIGGVKINFTDKDNIYNITSDSKDPVKFNYTKNGDTLNINLESNRSDTTFELSNKYQYNINSDIAIGGLTANFENGDVKNFNSKIILGGENLILTNGNVKKINTTINTGGANIIGNAKNKVDMNSEIVIGGINMEPNGNLNLKSHERLGGVNAESYTSKDTGYYTEYTGNNISDNVINLKSRIQIGGLNLI
ncbi:hypothetical protein [Methanobrevibacter sp. V14]|uniref:hypothetical protein n=1 Tax=Methanobrevibacter sp. V14 TaxID=3064280 RepID=UPI0027344A5C|nr:hypothetical protein [Methanobrevibacter sp. V14]